MKRMLGAMMAILLVSSLGAVPVWAADTLPKFDVPQLPPLEAPKLSLDYTKLLDELKTQGWGQYKSDPNKPLDIPNVEAPAGTGRTASDVFNQVYAERLKTMKPLDTTSSIPKGLDDALQVFGQDLKTSFDAAQGSSSEKMAALLSRTLDNSQQWDLDALKMQVQAKFKTPDQVKEWMDGTQKPSGWDAIKNEASRRNPNDSFGKMTRALGITDPEQLQYYRDNPAALLRDTQGRGMFGTFDTNTGKPVLSEQKAAVVDQVATQENLTAEQREVLETAAGYRPFKDNPLLKVPGAPTMPSNLTPKPPTGR